MDSDKLLHTNSQLRLNRIQTYNGEYDYKLNELGEIKEFGFNGHGMIRSVDGEIMVGEWKPPMLKHGKLFWCFHYYEGQFDNNMKEGKGIYRSPSKLYVGEFCKNLEEGKGLLHEDWTSKKTGVEVKFGLRYEGYFKQGRMHGVGMLITPEYSYEGEFAKGAIVDDSKRVFRNLNEPFQIEFPELPVLSGPKAEPILHTDDDVSNISGRVTLQLGKPTTFFSGNIEYNGQYDLRISTGEITPHGVGTIKYNSGLIYTGMCNPALKHHGYGVEYYSYYDGDWVDNVIQGTGIMKTIAGEIYKGEFKNSMFEGNGILFQHVRTSSGLIIEEFGTKIEGTFKANKAHGTCIVSNAHKKFEVVFREGVMMDHTVRVISY